MNNKINKSIIRAKIEILTNELANLCLREGDCHYKYDDEDLFNASVIFTHILMDVIFSTSKNIPQDLRMQLAQNTGESIRILIKESTGKDMVEIVKKLFKD